MAGPERLDRLHRLERLARSLNDALHAATVTGADGADLDAAVAEAEALARRLGTAVDPDPWAARMPAAAAFDPGHPRRFGADLGRMMPVNAVMGPYNPVAPPMELHEEDGGVVGSAYLGAAYMGPPGLVHGGIVAAVLDQLLGTATIVAGHPGYTGTLTVRFRKGTPLDTELSLEARLVKRSGRRAHAWGAISAGGAVTAEAEGVFVAPAGDLPRTAR